jgi:hypothetical protein
MRRILVIGLTALAAGCASNQSGTTYWTQKSDVVVVHHVVGTTDTMEKLTEKQLTDDEATSAGLPKGKYFKVVSAQAQVTPVARVKTEPKANAKASESRETDARIAEKIDDLRREVQTVVAQNQRLQDEIKNASTQQPVQQGPQQQTVQDNPDAPKLSQ